MNRFCTVFAHEFVQTVRCKSFKIITVILIIVLAAMCGCIALLAFGNTGADGSNVGLTTEVGTSFDPSESRIAVVSVTGDDSGERLANLIGAKLIENEDEESLKARIESGEFDSVAVLSRGEDGSFSVELYEKSTLYNETVKDIVSENLLMLRRLEMLAEYGVDETQAAMLLAKNDVNVNVHSVGEMAFAKYIVSFVVMIMMFVCITLYGQLVATSVATEKSTRTMELLVTSASARSLLMGKVLGTGAAVISQMGIFACCVALIVAIGAGISPAISSVLDTVLTLSGIDAFYLVAFFALGFLLIAFVYGALGSLVNQIEDLSVLTNFPTMIFMIGYFIAVMISSVETVGTFARVCSFIPFWSPMVMTVRMAAEEVPHIEIIISLLIQGAACVGVALFASKVYRMGTLLYGKTPKLSEIFKLLKHR